MPNLVDQDSPPARGSWRSPPPCPSLSWVSPGPELMTQVAKEKVVLCLVWFLLVRSFVRRSTV